ncbi:hypothetical protein [Bacillus sp. FSL K6-1003]|uniref:hypothetical protein n=1 Tax=Bacillus sp. FSL K6-1003 TaxID=2954675 RepID=UPI0030CDE8EC
MQFKDSGRNRAFFEFWAAHRFEEEADRIYHNSVYDVEDRSGHIEWVSSRQPAQDVTEKTAAGDVLPQAFIENTNAHWKVLHAEQSRILHIVALDTNRPEHLRALLVKEHIGAEAVESGPEPETE